MPTYFDHHPDANPDPALQLYSLACSLHLANMPYCHRYREPALTLTLTPTLIRACSCAGRCKACAGPLR